MVFHPEGQFQQFLHCKFKDNIVRLLYIPTLEDRNVFLAVNKYGRVGLYDPDRFELLLHTYCLDMSVPMHQTGGRKARKPLSNSPTSPKCQRTHLVVDAVYASDLQMVVFATTKGILQCYDIGEIETQSLGLEILPRSQFMKLRDGKSPVALKNKGHVETHRIFDLKEVPTCMEYCHTKDQNIQVTSKSASKLLIGDADGGVTIIFIDSPKFPFLGHRKIRGVLHKMSMTALENAGKLKSYKAHTDPVRDIRFLMQRQVIVSCSRDFKFSLFCEDFTGISDSFIISLPKGVNCLTYSDSLRILVTGCEDGVVRIFRQFSMKMPQIELLGHKSSIVAVEMLCVPFSDKPILITFSDDVELRAWDGESFQCLQSMYLGFPIKSTIICKTPEFAKRSLIVHQPEYKPPLSLHNKGSRIVEENVDKSSESRRMSKNPPRNEDGSIILIYCNSYAKLSIEKDMTHWPFNFQDFVTEFDEHNTKFEERMRKKLGAESKDPKLPTLSEDEESQIIVKAGKSQTGLLELKKKIEDSLTSKPLADNKDTLTFEGIQKLYSLETKKPFKEGMVRRSATMFDKISMYDITSPRPRLS